MNLTTFHLTSLGCSKNKVDSDSMFQLLERNGYHMVDAPEKASIIIVNTCGFINSAREESFSVLQSLAQNKKNHQLLIVAGCLTQRYGEEVARRVLGVDGILGTRRWMDIVDVIRRTRKNSVGSWTNGGGHKPFIHLPENITIGVEENGTMRASIAGASAFLKIAEGCRRSCAFCSIPLIKGPAISRSMDAIIDDARHLQDGGIRELVLIAQDTSDYGHDFGLKDGLSHLLDKLSISVPDIDWIRIMYAFPGYVTDRLIDTISTHQQVLPYLDIPLQHAAPNILKSMHRPSNIDWVRATIAKMRRNLPKLAIRTTFIVGYPGETEKDFQTLLDFVTEVRFDRVGTFQFSFEPGTISEQLGDPVPQLVKEDRYQRLMELQQSISLQINQTYVGKSLDVLIEGKENGIAVGRSYRDAPEIDGLVFVEGKANIGDIVPIRVTGAMAYDLIGTPVNKY